jgi:hypothetical protein
LKATLPEGDGVGIKEGFFMAKVFRPSTREASILSKIESSKEYARRMALNRIPEQLDSLSNAIAMRLVETDLVETKSKNSLQEQISKCLETLSRAEEFDIEYMTAPIRNLVPQPHVVSLYVTAFVIEKLINDKDVIDIYGSDKEIYLTINQQVKKHLP